MYLSRELTGSSLNNIGISLGRRKHSTVIHACNNVEQKILKDTSFKTLLKNMKKEIENFKFS